MNTHRITAFMSAIGLAAVVAAATPVAAADRADAEQLVHQARATVEKLRRDPDLPLLEKTLADAKGVLVVPNLFKAGLIIGGEGGSGVLLTRNAHGQWSYPAFYTLGSGSVGLQIGAQTAEAIFVIMTDKGLDQVIKNEFKLGADASVAVGPVGAGVEAATTPNLGADIYAFSKNRGLFGGGSLEGSVIHARDDLNRAYYGRTVTVRDIIIDRKVDNPGADTLRAALPAQRG